MRPSTKASLLLIVAIVIAIAITRSRSASGSERVLQTSDYPPLPLLTVRCAASGS